jgi:hypothetical protein
VPQDYVRAHQWANLAGSHYPAFGKENRDMAFKNRDLVAAKMTPAQIAEAQKLARVEADRGIEVTKRLAGVEAMLPPHCRRRCVWPGRGEGALVNGGDKLCQIAA